MSFIELIVNWCIFTARRYASAVLAVVNRHVSVRLSVRHTPVLYQNGQMQNHADSATR